MIKHFRVSLGRLRGDATERKVASQNSRSSLRSSFRLLFDLPLVQGRGAGGVSASVDATDVTRCLQANL